MSVPEFSLHLSVFQHFDHEDEETGRHIVLSESPVIVGRSAHSTIVLASNTVSSQHAEIFWEPNKKTWIIRDLKSRNGLVLGEQRLSEHYLQEGDRIFLGECLIRVDRLGADDERTRVFSILDAQPPKASPKSWSWTLVMGILALVAFSTTRYFETPKEMKNELWGTAIWIIFGWVLLMGLSWIMSREFKPVQALRYIVRTLSAWSLYIFLGSFLSFNFVSEKWEGWLEFAALNLAVFVSIVYLGREIGKYPKSRRSLIVGGVAVLLLILVRYADSQIGSALRLEMRYEYPLVILRANHTYADLEKVMTQQFESARSDGEP